MSTPRVIPTPDSGGDRLERIQGRRSRPERWHIVQDGEVTHVLHLGEALRVWEDLGHELPELRFLPRISKRRPAADLVWLLDREGLDYGVYGLQSWCDGCGELDELAQVQRGAQHLCGGTWRPEGDIISERLYGGRLELRREPEDGTDLASAWSWRRTARSGAIAEGALESYEQLARLLTEDCS